MSEDRDSPPWERAGQRPAATGAPWERQAPEMNIPAMFRRAQPGEGMSFPPPKPGDVSGPATAEWSPGKYLGGSMESLVGAGKDIAKGTGNLVGNFFKFLNEGPFTPPGKAAGMDVINQLGDIGMFATGGGGAISGPVETPRQVGRFGPGFGRGRPPEPPAPPEPAPGPQLALPSPAIGPAAPTRALPPPTVDVPGRPTPTGPGNIRPLGPTPGGTGFAYSPPPPTGAIPGGAATMRTVPEPPPRAPPTAAEIAGARAGRDLPPRAPGTEGRAPRAADAKPEPLIPVGAERGQPSPLASALLENDVSAVDRKLAKRMRQVTGVQRAENQADLDVQDREMTTLADSLILGKDNIQFRNPKDPTGNTLQRAGKTPTNLSEFVQGIYYLKKQLYQAYDQMATRVTGQGARVSLVPTVAKLREWAASDSARLTPTIRTQALQMADEFEQTGSYTPSSAQEVMETLNTRLSSFLNGHPTEEIYSHPTLMNQVRDTLLGSLNQTMAQALGGPQYQILRLRWGALTSVEANLANALSRQLSKRGGSFSRGLTTAEATAALAGTLHFGPPGAMASGAVIAGGRRLSRFLYSDNYAIRKMFNRRAADLAPPRSFDPTPYLSAQIASRLPNPPRPSSPYIGPSGM